MLQTPYHIPALLPQTIQALDIKPDGIYVDVTYGGGGHSRAIVELLTTGHLYSMDQDIEAVERAMVDPRFTIIHGNFRYLENFLRYEGVAPGEVNGLLADLGVSFHHFDDPERGFSFRYDDGKLDMRMNQRSPLTAARLLAEATEERLADILYLYGEMKNARRIAGAIVKARAQGDIDTVARLLEVVKPYINPKQEKKELAQVFQALRIEVNGELTALRALLTQAVKMLAPGGRLAVITYQSLEDRLVKNFLKTGNFEGKVVQDFYGRVMCDTKLLTSKPVTPDAAEVEANPRSRSAKLRIGVKI